MYFHQAFIVLFSFYSYNMKVLLLDSKKHFRYYSCQFIGFLYLLYGNIATSEVVQVK